MPEALSRLKEQFTDLWKNLDKSQRNRIYITSGLLLVALTIGIIMLSRTTYVPLMTIDDSQDLSEIEKALQDKKIISRVTGDRSL